MDPERFRVNQQDPAPETEPLQSLPPAPEPGYKSKQPRKKAKKWVWLVLSALIILVIAVLLIVDLNHKTTPKSSAANLNQKTLPKAISKPAPTIPTDSYTAADYSTTFSYPTTWTVVDSGNAPLTVTSPVLTLTSDTGESVLGQIVMTIANQGSVPPAFTSSSVAVLNSLKITFSHPSISQAADTYISFVQYPSTDIKGGLDGIYLSGNYGYVKDQAIPSSNIASVDPFIDFTFYSCASQGCPISTRQNLTISSSEWNQSSFSAPILVILKSFSFN